LKNGFYLYFNITGGIFMLSASLFSNSSGAGSKIAAFTALSFFLSGCGIYFHKKYLHLAGSLFVSFILGVTSIFIFSNVCAGGNTASAGTYLLAVVLLIIAFVELSPFFDNKR